MNSRPFWYIRMITRHYKAMLCGAFIFYGIAAYTCVSLGLMTLDELRNEDFFIQSLKDTPLFFTHEAFKVTKEYPHQASMDELQWSGRFDLVVPTTY